MEINLVNDTFEKYFVTMQAASLTKTNIFLRQIILLVKLLKLHHWGELLKNVTKFLRLQKSTSRQKINTENSDACLSKNLLISG